MIGHAPTSLVVHPSFPARTVAELITYARANPGKINFGSAGVGTVGHITGEYFARSAGIRLVHIPYKGASPALSDLLGGHIPMAFAPIPATHANISAGLLRALAVTSKARNSLLPDVPTMIEAGLPFFDASLYYGLVAPAGTPRPIIDRLNEQLRAALASDEVKKQLGLDGTEITPGSPPISSTRTSGNGRNSSRRAASSRSEGTAAENRFPLFQDHALESLHVSSSDSSLRRFSRACRAADRAAGERDGCGCASGNRPRRHGAGGVSAGDRGISTPAQGVSGGTRSIR
jgi:hypothetical protein